MVILRVPRLLVWTTTTSALGTWQEPGRGARSGHVHYLLCQLAVERVSSLVRGLMRACGCPVSSLIHHPERLRAVAEQVTESSSAGVGLTCALSAALAEDCRPTVAWNA